jgi:hypothetical protein
MATAKYENEKQGYKQELFGPMAGKVEVIH